jgi:uncharacterized protein YukE
MGADMTAAGAGATVPPTKSMQTDLQKRITNNLALITQMHQAGETYSPELLTIWGRAKKVGAKFLDYLGAAPKGSPQADFIEKQTNFYQASERLFNAYRKAITGAAASFQELERLRKSFLNPNMSPREFESAWGSYMTELQRLQQIYNKLLREGFTPTSDPNSEYSRRLNREFLSGAPNPDNVSARGAELDDVFKSQYPKQEHESQKMYQNRIDGLVFDMLEKEGYRNEKLYPNTGKI